MDFQNQTIFVDRICQEDFRVLYVYHNDSSEIQGHTNSWKKVLFCRFYEIEFLDQNDLQLTDKDHAKHFVTKIIDIFQNWFHFHFISIQLNAA